MYKLPVLKITWNDDVDAYMTRVESRDDVLREFFKIKDWNFIRHIFHAVIEEEYAEFDNKSIVFEEKVLSLYVNDQVSQLEKYDGMHIFSYLFDLMIVGANDDHHGIRYETWWQEFTEASYQLKCKLEVYQGL